MGAHRMKAVPINKSQFPKIIAPGSRELKTESSSNDAVYVFAYKFGVVRKIKSSPITQC
jgi:hypothetical protein